MIIFIIPQNFKSGSIDFVDISLFPQKGGRFCLSVPLKPAQVSPFHSEFFHKSPLSLRREQNKWAGTSSSPCFHKALLPAVQAADL
jgi:hypothetical protein